MDQPRRIRTPAAVQNQAKELRQEMTLVEKILWAELRGRRLQGLKFKRQCPLGPFIADFYCAEHRLVLEVDGAIHELQVEQDQERTRCFEEYGYRVIRFQNCEVEDHLDAVLKAIVEACKG